MKRRYREQPHHHNNFALITIFMSVNEWRGVLNISPGVESNGSNEAREMSYVWGKPAAHVGDHVRLCPPENYLFS